MKLFKQHPVYNLLKFNPSTNIATQGSNNWDVTPGFKILFQEIFENQLRDNGTFQTEINLFTARSVDGISQFGVRPFPQLVVLSISCCNVPGGGYG